MKFHKIITVVLLLFVVNTYAQDKVYLKDGKILKGRIRTILKGKVQLKHGKKGKTKGYSSNKVLKVVDFDGSESVTYTYRDINGIPKTSLSGELIKGKASLYVTYFYVHGSGRSVDGGGSIVKEMGGGYAVYYIYIEGRKKALKVMGNSLTTPFYKRVSKYLSDCTSISTSVKNKEYHYKDIEEIIEKYNENCGDSSATKN